VNFVYFGEFLSGGKKGGKSELLKLNLELFIDFFKKIKFSKIQK
jgi:hypothetical protein